MSGSPYDGLPWWAKPAVFIAFSAISVVEVIADTKASVVRAVKKVVGKDKPKN